MDIKMAHSNTAYEQWEREKKEIEYDNSWLEVDGNYIHETAVINWERVQIGEGNTIFPGAVIGTAPQHKKTLAHGKVKIGNNNVIRENVVINSPTQLGGGLTEVRDNCYLMINSHVGHDTIIEDDVTLCNNVTPGGHVWIMKGAVLGFGVLIHQYQVIGSYSMVGMGTIIPANAKITPGHIYYGNPVQQHGVNSVGMERNNITYKEMANERIRYDSILSEVKKHYAK